MSFLLVFIVLLATCWSKQTFSRLDDEQVSAMRRLSSRAHSICMQESRGKSPSRCGLLEFVLVKLLEEAGARTETAAAEDSLADSQRASIRNVPQSVEEALRNGAHKGRFDALTKRAAEWIISRDTVTELDVTKELRSAVLNWWLVTSGWRRSESAARLSHAQPLRRSNLRYHHEL